MTELELGALKLVKKYAEFALQMSNDEDETKKLSDMLGMIAELERTDGSEEQVAEIVKKYKDIIDG